MQRLGVALVVVWLAVMCLWSRPSRVGDASEYVAMAGRLASGRPPAMAAADMDAFTRSWAGTPQAYELQTRQLAPLRSVDERYDMPHPWVYPLVAVPGVWLARATGLADPWGLVFLNLGLLAGVLWMAVRRGAGPWTLTFFAGPLVWWIDKPVADLFIACLVAASALAWPHPASIAWLGLAAAQNPALGVAAATFTIAALVADPGRLRARAWHLGVCAGVGLATLPVAYYLVRLGRLSPLTMWTAVPSWPSLASISHPLLDLNTGFVPRFLPGALAVSVALLTRGAWRVPGAWPGGIAMVLMLLVVSLQVNQNPGGNPDFSRYWLWIWPFALPCLLARDQVGSRASRAAGMSLLLASMAWSATTFRMDRPESYRYATPLATWVWRMHPRWSSPLPEAFAERTSHREPALVPTATDGCEKVLLSAGTWPASCPPLADAPAHCRQRGALCYADARGDGTYTFGSAGTQAGTNLEVHDRTWPRADEASAWVARQTRGARAGDDTALASIRGVWGAAWRQSWVAREDRQVVYLRDVADGARVAIRHPHPLHIRVTRFGDQAREVHAVPGAEPTMIALPAGTHVIVDIRPAETHP